MTDRVGNMDALEIVEKIRIGDTSNMKDPWDVKQLTDNEAATMIEQYAKRVPSAMLNEVWLNGYKYSQGKKDTDMAEIAAKYGVKIEEGKV